MEKPAYRRMALGARALVFVGFLSLTSCSLIASIFSGIPAAPTGVQVSAAIATVTVSWSSVFGATSYTVYDTIDGTTPSASNYADSNSPSGTATTITYRAETPGTLKVVVTASNNNAEGNGSSPVTVSTLVPTNVAATVAVWNTLVNGGSGGGQTTISWNAVPGAMSYNLYHTYSPTGGAAATPTEVSGGGPGPSTFEPAADMGLPGPSRTFTMAYADPTGATFNFAVSAVDANGYEGALSAVVGATNPGP